MEAAVDKVIAAEKKYNLPVGYPSGSPDRMKEMIKRGIRLFQAAGDLGFMRHGAQELIKALYQPDGKGGMEIPY